MKAKMKYSLMTLMLVLMGISNCYGETFNVDMENTGVCTSVTPVPVGQYDIYNIYAQPPQDGTPAVRGKCTVRFFAPDGQKFKLFLRDLFFRECQIYVRFYDGDRFLNTHRNEFGCNSATGTMVYSHSSEIALSLEKADSTSTGYQFYFRLALVGGPDIGGEGEPPAEEGTGLTTGVIVVIVIGCLLLLVLTVAAILYCIFVYRKKKEEKDLALTRSRSTLFGASVKDGDSVHSSKHSMHSTHSTHSTHFTKEAPQLNYPAFRTKASISEKAPKCNSIDTKSFDSDPVDEGDSPLKPILVKNIKNEFNAMKKGLVREERRQHQEKEDLMMQERRWKETRQADRRSREESNRGLNRSTRSRENRAVLNEENIRRSAREDRHRGRSRGDDYDDRLQRSSRAGSSRSTRTRERSRGHSPARSGGAWSEPDYISKHREHSRERDRERSHSGSRHRSHSSGTQSRRKRDYYDDRDAYSDYEEYNYRSGSRDRHNSHRSSRSGTQRSRTHSASRHHR